VIGSKLFQPKAGLFAMAFLLASSPLLSACSGRDTAAAEKIAAAQDAAARAEKAAERAEKAAGKAERGPPTPFAAESEPAEQQDNAETPPNEEANPDANTG
jgi:hypothetical protein